MWLILFNAKSIIPWYPFINFKVQAKRVLEDEDNSWFSQYTKLQGQ